MESVVEYRKLAHSLDRDSFVMRFPHPFLVKRPTKHDMNTPGERVFSFQTVQSKFQHDPFSTEWRLAPVVKKEGNPFPERLTVGRATNCDVVIRLPFVSKLHAHLLKGADESLQLTCLKEGGTPLFLNGRVLQRGESQSLSGDCVISFGSLNLELMSAQQLYDVLRRITPEMA